MSQAIASPDELERFASNLSQFNSELGSRLSALNGQFASLGETWRDQEHQKFAEEFSHAVQVLERFMHIADEHTPFLVRKAQRVRDYLEQR